MIVWFHDNLKNAVVTRATTERLRLDLHPIQFLVIIVPSIPLLVENRVSVHAVYYLK